MHGPSPHKMSLSPQRETDRSRIKVSKIPQFRILIVPAVNICKVCHVCKLPGAQSAPSDSLAGFKGPTSKGKEGKGGTEERGGVPLLFSADLGPWPGPHWGTSVFLVLPHCHKPTRFSSFRITPIILSNRLIICLTVEQTASAFGSPNLRQFN